LPYGTTRCAWDVILPFDRLWQEYHRVLRPDGNILLFGAQPFTTLIVNSNLREFRYCLYWLKEKGTGFLNAKHQPLRIIEEICVFYQHGTATYHPQMVPLVRPRKRSLPRRKTTLVHHETVASFASDENVVIAYTHQHPTSLIECGRDFGNVGLIPTQKPVALLEHLIQTYSNAGDLILDNTMGSGTTGVACVNLDRDFIGIERDAKHFAIAANRMLTLPAWAVPA
jgi:DNA modification methylase